MLIGSEYQKKPKLQCLGVTRVIIFCRIFGILFGVLNHGLIQLPNLCEYILDHMGFVIHSSQSEVQTLMLVGEELGLNA